MRSRRDSVSTRLRRSVDTWAKLFIENLEPRKLLSATPLIDLPSGGLSPSDFFELGSTALFTGSAGQNQNGLAWGLYSTDGTPAGTSRLTSSDGKAIQSLIERSRSRPVEFDGKAYFGATDTVSFDQSSLNLWSSDGTSTGTTEVADLLLQTYAQEQGNPWALANSGKLFFVGATSSSHVDELYTTSGAGFDAVSTLLPTPHKAVHALLGAIGDEVLFTDVTTTGTTRLLVTDGTATGTSVLCEFAVGVADPIAQQFSATADGTGYFLMQTSQGTKLWKTNGTTAGTGVVDTGTIRLMTDAMAAVGNEVYFLARPANDSTIQFYASNGTNGGTRLISDQALSTGIGSGPYTTDFVTLNDTVYVSTFSSEFGPALWQSDGTSTGTRLLTRTSSSSIPVVRGNQVWSGVYYVDASAPGVLRTAVTGGSLDAAAAPVTPTTVMTPAVIGSHVVFSGTGTTQDDLFVVERSPAAVVSGVVFTDTDADGRQDLTELTASGTTVFLDANGNGVWNSGEAQTTSGAFGRFTFDNVSPGTYRVFAMSATARITGPGTSGYPITVTASSDGFAGLYFGLNYDHRIYGAVFEDLDNDGVRDAGEVGITGRTVYLDKDRDGVLDTNEPTITTDNDGNFYFPTAPNGTYDVRTVQPSGWRSSEENPKRTLSLSANQATDDVLTPFASTTLPPPGRITGTLFADRDSDGSPDASPAFASLSSTVFLDANDNGILDSGEYSVAAQSSYTFPSVVPGTYRVRVVSTPGIVQTSGLTGTAPLLTITTNESLTATPVGIGPNLGSSASISGTVFIDSDFDGVIDSNEVAWPSLTVIFNDTNNNGFADSGELATFTDLSGQYRFAGLSNATYPLRTPRNLDAPQTYPTGIAFPGNPPQTVVYSGTAVTGANFGLVSASTASIITGTVFADTDGDGVRDSGEVGIPNIVVMIDGNEDSTSAVVRRVLTDANGAYTAYVSVTSHTIRTSKPGGWLITAPANNFRSTSTTQFGIISGQDFALVPLTPFVVPAAVTGNVSNDLDADGLIEAGESGLATRTVYLDTNNNGLRDGGEPRAYTNADGDYVIGGVTPGTYAVRIDVPRSGTGAGWITTSPAGGSQTVTISAGAVAASVNFAAALRPGGFSGTVFNDYDGDGVRDPDEPVLPGAQVFADIDGSGTINTGDELAYADGNGVYTFTGFSPGQYAVTGRYGTGWEPTFPLGSGIPTATVVASTTTTGVDFGMRLPTGGVVTGNLFYDRNANGIKDESEAYLPQGYAFFLDDDDPNTPRLTTTTTAAGTFGFQNVPAGTYHLTLEISDRTHLTSPANGIGYDVTVVAGQIFGPYSFGFKSLPVSFSGRVYNDANANDYPDSTETGLADVVIYRDLNDNHLLDAGETQTTTDANGLWSFTGLDPDLGPYLYRVQNPSGWAFTNTNLDLGDFAGDQVPLYHPTANFISGTVFEDLDYDGVRDPGEPGIPFQTVSNDDNAVKTDREGWYAFYDELGTHDYKLLQTLQPGWMQTSPGQFDWHAVSFTSGDAVTGMDFGTAPLAFAGSVFNDLNANGIADGSDTGIAGRTVWIDSNNNGLLDSGERTSVTGADGKYLISDIIAGTYSVRQQLPTGWLQSSPTNNGPASVDIATGLMKSSVSFGAYQPAQPSEVILDNTSPTAFSSTGAWVVGSGVSGFLGSNFLYDNNKNKGKLTAAWNANLVAGTYEVFARWTSSSSRSAKVPYVVNYAGGSKTVNVNQQQNGGSWQSLGVYTFGASGSVFLSNTGTSGNVIADSVRFMPVVVTPPTPPSTPPGLAASAAGSSSINVSWTDVANETGYVLQRSTTADFTTGLVETTPVANATLASITGLTADTTYYFRIKSRNAAGDSDWSPVASARTDAAPPAPAEVIIDNASLTGFTTVGAWSVGSGVGGFTGSNFLYDGGKNKGKLTATYSTPLAAGSYEVFAMWAASSNRSTATPYEITRDGGKTTVKVNQKLNGGVWVSLGTFNFSGGTGVVTISNTGTSGYVVVDAVKFVKTGSTPTDPPPATEIVLDTGSTGVTKSSGWTSSKYDPGYLGTDYLSDGNTGRGTKWVKYTPTTLTAGKYEVWACWTASNNRASNARYEIAVAGGATPVIVTKSQKTNGGVWVLLGTYDLSTGASVTLSNTAADGYVVADGVKFVKV